MFSAYLARPPTCRGRAQSVAALRLLAATSLYTVHSIRCYPRTLRRSLSSTARPLKEDGPPVPSGSVRALPALDSDDKFQQNSGFMPLENKLQSEVEQNIPANPLEFEANPFEAVLPSHHHQTKLDLSYNKPLFPTTATRESTNSDEHSEATSESLIHEGGLAVQREVQTPGFRSNKGLRKLVAGWAASADRLSPFGKGDTLYEVFLHREEKKVFNEKALALLARSGHGAENVKTWSWILTSHSSSLAVERYLDVMREGRIRGDPPIPIFVPLQLLRAQYIPARQFRKILASLKRTLGPPDSLPPTKPGSTEQEQDGGASTRREVESVGSSKEFGPTAINWDAGSFMVLMVRALRHARVVAPETLDTIAEIACDHLLGPGSPRKSNLTDTCNRLLKLIALPTTAHPFRNILLQQSAQVRLVRGMVSHVPELPVTREGYRALINVQLAHQKLDQEVDWGRAKSLSWPPWREDKLGIDASLPYPGREARAFKLLRRITEAGHAHTYWESAAKIHAGWDTDNSPTIQNRHLLPTPVAGGDATAAAASDIHGMIWGARITATRTVREAWAAFLTYRKETVTAMGSLRTEPFEAMFEVLFAPQHKARPSSTAVPGDGRERWSDPTNGIDAIYVDKEPPTVQELYKQMRKDGVRPHERLLSSLLRNSHELDDGIKYITDAKLTQTQKNVLLNVHAHTLESVRQTLGTLSPRLLGAVLYHLFSAQGNAKFAFQLRREDGSTLSVTPQEYAFKLLEQSKSGKRSVYLEAVRGLLFHLWSIPRSGAAYKKFVLEVVVKPQFPLQLMRANNVDHDFTSFGLITQLLHLVLAPKLVTNTVKRLDTLNLVKQMFAYCVQSEADSPEWLSHEGPLPPEAVPDPFHLRLMVETLGMFHDTQGLSELIAWMSQHASDFQRVHQHIRTADEQMRAVMIVSRILYEGWLYPDAKKDGLFENLLNTAGQRLPMPTDDECTWFAAFHTNWARRHRRYTKLHVGVRQQWKSDETQDGQDRVWSREREDPEGDHGGEYRLWPAVHQT